MGCAHFVVFRTEGWGCRVRLIVAGNATFLPRRVPLLQDAAALRSGLCVRRFRRCGRLRRPRPSVLRPRPRPRPRSRPRPRPRPRAGGVVAPYTFRFPSGGLCCSAPCVLSVSLPAAIAALRPVSFPFPFRRPLLLCALRPCRLLSGGLCCSAPCARAVSLPVLERAARFGRVFRKKSAARPRESRE